MRARQPEPQVDDHPARNFEQDVPVVPVPDFARAWEQFPEVASAVRRPFTFPNPKSYHEAVELEAIFELDEIQQDGSIETILVTPFSCKRCRGLKQACSRGRPACHRCSGAGITCKDLQEGYQRLPGPKCIKKGKQDTNRTSGKNLTEAPSTQSRSAPAGRLRDRRITPREVSLSQVSPRSSPAPASKRSLSPDSDFAPSRKKMRARKARRVTVAASRELPDERAGVLELDSSTQVVSALASSGKRSALEWTFVKKARVRGRKSCTGQDSSHVIPANTPLPRVWTNSLDGLLTVSPDLAKSPAGFSWLPSGTPILLLGTNHDQGRWINPTTLGIDLSWDFSCDDLELEPITESNVGDSRRRSCPLDLHPPEGDQHPRPNETEMLPMDEEMSTPLQTFGAPMAPSYTIQQDPFKCQAAHSELHASDARSMYTAAPSVPVSAGCSTQHPVDPPSLVGEPPSSILPLPPESPILRSKPQAGPQPRIPISKPPEVETLLNSHRCSIPLLLWIPHDSRLLPSSLPSEYAYLCLGTFFISDLRRTMIQHDASSAVGVVKGRVCWSATLQWAPGGEDLLFECQRALSSDTMDSTPPDNTRDLQRPWWLGPAEPLPQKDDTIPYDLKDSRTQFSSFLPLDLLADFCPSEAFPLGWFCKSCGMINTQQFFRHQICQSSVCQSLPERHIPEGTIVPLPSLRDFYQSSTLIQPVNRIPSTIDPHCVPWDDGMQSWIYDLRDGVSLCHIFTGNQEQLQGDATTLLEAIQRDVLLRKEDPSGPYFTHTTRVIHPSDGSEARVPGGTPDCVRTAYHSLCDFVLRYGEMEKPRFGEVCMQAWVNTGSKKGSALRAIKSPVVVHCLGAEVVLNITPNGGYKGCAESTGPDKGKESAHNQDLKEPQPRAGPSRHFDLPGSDRTSFNMCGAEPNESPIIAETVHGPLAAVDTICQPSSRTFDADGATIPSSNAPHSGPGLQANHHEPVEPKQKRVDNKNKVIKGKKKASTPKISVTLVHGDCLVLSGDDFECQIVRTGTTILVMGFPEVS